jgi:hypothetical protein
MRLGRLVSAGILLLVGFHGSPGRAADAETQQRALYLVREAADRLCVTPPVVGSGGDLELRGEARVKLDNLLKRLLDMGAEGAVQYQSEQSRSVLREELATAVKDGNDCKLAVLATLQDKLIPGAEGQRPLVATPPPVPDERIDAVTASFQDSNPAKRRAALLSALADPEPEVRSVALFEALSKLKILSGEMTPIVPEGRSRTTRGIQLQIAALDPVTGQLETVLVGSGKTYVGVIQGTSVTLVSDACSLNLELDAARTLRGTFTCPKQNPQDVRLPVM